MSLLLVKAHFYTHLLEPSKKMFTWEDRYIIHCSGASATLDKFGMSTCCGIPFVALNYHHHHDHGGKVCWKLVSTRSKLIFFISPLGVGAENYCRIQNSITPVLWEATCALAMRCSSWDYFREQVRITRLPAATLPDLWSSELSVRKKESTEHL